MKRRDINEVIKEIIDFATIDEQALSLARERWQKLIRIRDASFDPLQYANLYEQQDRIRPRKDQLFDGTIRLIDECEKLRDFVAQSDKNDDYPESRLTFVLDADLFSNFARVDSSPRYCFRGFNFLLDGIKSAANFDPDRDKHLSDRNYFVALLGELFRMDFPIAITDTGIGELSNLPSRFLRAEEDKAKTEYQFERLDQARRHADHLSKNIRSADERINTITKIFRLSERERAERTNDAFNQIVHSIAIPSSINNYILARLNYALRSTKHNLGRVNSIIAMNLRNSDQNDDAVDFESVFRDLNNKYRPAINAARRSMEDAYKIYLKEYWGNDEFGYGHIENVSALFEIHLANCVLDKLEINHTARYVHKNFSLFGFLRGFPRGRVSVPSLHPRFAFFYARPSILSERVKSGNDSFLPSEHLKVVATLVSSFESRIFSDGKITFREYGIFSDTVQALLDQIQEMHCSLLIGAKEFDEEPEIRRIQAKAAYEGLVSYFDTIQEKCEQYRGEWKEKKLDNKRIRDISKVDSSIVNCMSVLDKISGYLEDSLLLTKVSLADQIQEARTYKKNSAYSRTSIMHLEACVHALDKITQNSDDGEYSKMLISVFRPLVGGKAVRVNVIPMMGGYRYLFTLHSRRLSQHIGESLGDGLVLTHAFCREAISFCSNNLPMRVESVEAVLLLSSKYLISAFQSASLRNWNLSLTLVEIAIGYLDDALDNASEVDRNIYIAQKTECIPLEQFALRALSEETHFKVRKKNLLVQAWRKLDSGLEAVTSIDSNFFQIRTPIVPHSLRFLIGRVAIEVEKDLGVSRGYLPKEMELNWLAWLSVDSDILPKLDSTIIDELNKSSGKKATKTKYVRMGQMCKQILQECLKIRSGFNDGEYSGHSVDMWEFVCLRVAQTYDFVALVEFLFWGRSRRNYANYRVYSCHQFNELEVMQLNLAKRDLRQFARPDGGVYGTNNAWGLMAAVKFYFEVCESLSKDQYNVPDVSLGSAWRKLQFACSGLVQTGIPRYVINELKEGVRQEIVARSHYSTKDAPFDESPV